MNPTERATRNWLALLALPSVGRRSAIHRLRESTLAAHTSRWDEQTASCFDRAMHDLQLSESARADALNAADEILTLCIEHRIAILPCFAHRFPARLRSIPDPPAAVFLHGALPDSAPQLAVAGTRSPDPSGLQRARRIARHAADARWSLITGLARGVDSLTHDTFLRLRQTPSLGIIAGGHDTILRAHRAPLIRKIIACGGGILSEQPPGQTPRPHNFVQRNRLISGLANAVFLVQAGLNSGTMHTARFARSQGRPLAIPHDVLQSDAPHDAGLRELLFHNAPNPPRHGGQSDLFFDAPAATVNVPPDLSAWLATLCRTPEGLA